MSGDTADARDDAAERPCAIAPVRVGRGEFYAGDCLEVMAQLPPASVDIVLCDLPYGVTACEWDSVIPLDALWVAYDRVLKPGAPVVLTATQPFTSALVMSRPRWFRHSWVWEKNMLSGFLSASARPMRAHEDVIVFCEHAPAYAPQMERGEWRASQNQSWSNCYGHIGPNPNAGNTSNQRYPRSVQRFDCERGMHPTQKPVGLFRYFLRTYGPEGGVVLDNCAGSGTTAIAAEIERREWVCIERDPDYARAAIERVTIHASQIELPL